MDPSINLCTGYDSLTKAPPELVDNNIWYTSTEPISLSPSYNLIVKTEYPASKYCDIKSYSILQQIKDTFNHPLFLEARNATNPFEYIGQSIFFDHQAVELANLDAVYHITNHIFTFDNKTSDKIFTFCDIASKNNSFTQYLQYRFPQSRGYGLGLTQPDSRIFDINRFFPFYGGDNTGDLYTNWDSFISHLNQYEADGVDLIVANTDITNEDTSISKYQEFLSSRALIIQALIGISCNKNGGNLVIKLFDTVTNFSAQIIFILAQCYENILLFKPCSSRPDNAERYLICRHRQPETQSYQVLLSDAIAQYTDTMYLTSIFAEPLPFEFETWLTDLNATSINLQLQTSKHILSYLNNEPYTLPSYNSNKFLTIWNLPDTPQHSKFDRIIVR